MTSIHTINGVTIAITANDKDTPGGKLAEAAILFSWTGMEPPAALASAHSEQQTEARATQAAIGQAIALNGLKLVGFAIWQRRNGSGRNVTFPARHYFVNGERRSFAVLKPARDTGSLEASMRLRDLILAAYELHEHAVRASQARELAEHPSDALVGSQANIDHWSAQPYEAGQPNS